MPGIDNIFGLTFVCVGLAILLTNRRIVEVIARGNAAAFGNPAFGSRAFILYGRAVLCLGAAGFITIGAGFVLGYLKFD